MTGELTRHPESAGGYQQELAAILDTPLTPDTISTYAYDALERLITLTDAAVQDYASQPTYSFATGKQQEDAALNYFGMPDMSTVLDHVGGLAQEIQELDQILDSAEVLSGVITPPEAAAGINANGGKDAYEPAGTRELTKTVLLVLHRTFDVDVHDPERLKVARGIVLPSMVRKESYYLLDVPELERAILACDEHGNMTYVFDTAKLAELGMDTGALANMSKPELNELIKSQAGLGRPLRQSANFVSYLTDALEDISGQSAPAVSAEDGRFLQPQTADTIQSARALAREWGIHRVTIARAAQELADKLGPVKMVRFQGREIADYSGPQKTILHAHLERNGYFKPVAPEGYQAVSAFARNLNLSHKTVLRCIRGLTEELGEVESFRFGVRVASGLSPDQQDRITEALRAQGALMPLPGDGILSAQAIADAWGMDKGTLAKAIDQLGDRLGPVADYKFINMSAPGFDAAQQAILRDYFEQRGHFKKAPEDVRSIGGMAQAWGVPFERIGRTIDALRESDGLGEVHKYRLGGIYTDGFDEGQQAKIHQELEKNGAFLPPAPEGAVSLYGLSNVLKVGRPRLAKAVAALVEQGVIEEPQMYSFGPAEAVGLLPEQQEAVRAYIENESKEVPPMPEGVCSISGLAESIGVNREVARRAYDQLIAEGLITPGRKYRVRSTQAEGLDAVTQKLISARLAESARSSVREKAAAFLQRIMAGAEPDGDNN